MVDKSRTNDIQESQVNPIEYMTNPADLIPGPRNTYPIIEIPNRDRMTIEQVEDFIKHCTVQEVPGGSCPSQYSLPEDAKELQDLVEHRDMNFAIGNIFKACYRMGSCSHSDKIRDLNKILWFAQRELNREESR